MEVHRGLSKGTAPHLPGPGPVPAVHGSAATVRESKPGVRHHHFNSAPMSELGGWAFFTLGAQCEPPLLESRIDAAFPDGLRRVLCGVLSQQFESRLMAGTSRRRRLPNSLLAGWLLAGGCVCSALHRGGVESGWVCSAAAAADVWEGGLVMVCLLLVVVKFEDGRRCAQTKQSSRFSDVGPEEGQAVEVECRVSMAISPRNHRFCLLEGGRGGRGVCAGIFNDVNSHGSKGRKKFN